MDLISNIFLQTTFIFIIYKTNVIYEYLKYLRLNIIKDYEKYLVSNDYLNFIEYLGFKNSFIFKLINCPLCFNFWLSFINSLVLNNILSIGVIYISTLFIFFINSYLYGKFKY